MKNLLALAAVAIVLVLSNTNSPAQCPTPGAHEVPMNCSDLSR